MSRDKLRAALDKPWEVQLKVREDFDLILAAARCFGCSGCDGCGEVDEDGVPRSEWAKLPKQSRQAYDMGLVKFVKCPDCLEDRKKLEAD